MEMKEKRPSCKTKLITSYYLPIMLIVTRMKRTKSEWGGKVGTLVLYPISGLNIWISGSASNRSNMVVVLCHPKMNENERVGVLTWLESSSRHFALIKTWVEEGNIRNLDLLVVEEEKTRFQNWLSNRATITCFHNPIIPLCILC